MLSFFTSLLPTSFLPEWLSLEMNPLDCALQGEFFSSLFSVVSTWAIPTLIWPDLSCFLAVWPAGLIGACGISVLCSLMRVHLFLEEHRWGIYLLPDLALEIESRNCMDSQLSILKRSTNFLHILKMHLFSVFLIWPPSPAAAIKMKKTHWIRRHTVIKGQIQMDSTAWFSFSLWLWFWQ